MKHEYSENDAIRVPVRQNVWVCFTVWVWLMYAMGRKIGTFFGYAGDFFVMFLNKRLPGVILRVVDVIYLPIKGKYHDSCPRAQSWNASSHFARSLSLNEDEKEDNSGILLFVAFCL